MFCPFFSKISGFSILSNNHSNPLGIGTWLTNHSCEILSKQPFMSPSKMIWVLKNRGFFVAFKKLEQTSYFLVFPSKVRHFIDVGLLSFNSSIFSLSILSCEYLFFLFCHSLYNLGITSGTSLLLCRSIFTLVLYNNALCK